MTRGADSSEDGEARAARSGNRGRSARDRALGLLAVRWRSRAELWRRLRQAGFPEEEIHAVLEDLEAAGLVDDARFAAEVVRNQTARRLSGPRALRAALREKGVAQDVAEAAMAEAGDDEEDRALRLASSRAARLASLAPDAAHRRLLGLLQRRGYSSAVARRAAHQALADRLEGHDADLAGEP